MDYIFDHEKLRIDEIMQRVCDKNNFTPSKPLRNSNLNFRRSSIDSYSKAQMNLSNISNFKQTGFRSETQSTSPLFIQSFQNSTHRYYKDNQFSKKKILPQVLPSLEKSIKLLRMEKEITKMFPIIHRPLNLIERQTRVMKNDELRKKSQSLIAYIPTVSFVKDKEESKKYKEKLNKNRPFIDMINSKGQKNH
ncbi:hypothetical protein SteCoe_6365 [Stentor coeruleus]|uniref:Uncharacterized protein n=1 Tax=Stentor coeruleus TaxID=5963 RepID=A0A1R2CQ26_9CILI|nr:hypothetical protein SteCoe_6365 [Stentor coeruleus]